MQLRRSARLLVTAGALLLAAPTLTSCGFNYATDVVYTPAAGTNATSERVDVLGAVIVSAEDGSGTLIASFSNNETDTPAVVTDISSDDASVVIDDIEPIEIPAAGLVNLADAETPIAVEGDFTTGEFLSLSFTLGDGNVVTVDIPSVADCYQYAGLDATAETGTPADECEPEAPAAEH